MRAEDLWCRRAVAPWAFGASLLLAAASLALGAGSAAAALSEEDPWGGQRCPSGEGAGQCSNPRAGSAPIPRTATCSSPTSSTAAFSEFNALGQFIKAWGWDVQPGGGAGFEICTAATGCKSGVSGAGAGQFAAPLGARGRFRR